MKNILTFFLALAAVVIPALVHAEVAVVGKPAPDFTGTDASGAKQTLSQYAGKYVVLEWFNPGCPFVKKHYGTKNMQGLQKKLTDDGVVWLTIDSSAEGHQGYLDAGAATALYKEEGMHSTALILDPSGKIGHLYDAKTTPHMFLVGPDGKLLYAGAIDDQASADSDDVKIAKNFITAAYDEAKRGVPITTSATESYGCGVKYSDPE